MSFPWNNHVIRDFEIDGNFYSDGAPDWNEVLDQATCAICSGCQGSNSGNPECAEQNGCAIDFQVSLDDPRFKAGIFCDFYTTHEISNVGGNGAKANNPLGWMEIETSSVQTKSDLTTCYWAWSVTDLQLCSAFEKFDDNENNAFTIAMEFNQQIGQVNDADCNILTTHPGEYWRCQYPLRTKGDFRSMFNVQNGKYSFRVQEYRGTDPCPTNVTTVDDWCQVASSDDQTGPYNDDRGVRVSMNFQGPITAPVWGSINSGSYSDAQTNLGDGLLGYQSSIPRNSFVEACYDFRKLLLKGAWLTPGKCLKWVHFYTLSGFSSGSNVFDTSGIIGMEFRGYELQCFNPNNSFAPSPAPTLAPIIAPTLTTEIPTVNPTDNPSKIPTKIPTLNPSNTPTNIPSKQTITPTLLPTVNPTSNPSNIPTSFPTKYPSNIPSKNTNVPTNYPSDSPSKTPTKTPTSNTKQPTTKPTNLPTTVPSRNPTKTGQTLPPTKSPIKSPTKNPLKPNQSHSPSIPPTMIPSKQPIKNPTINPTKNPTTEDDQGNNNQNNPKDEGENGFTIGTLSPLVSSLLIGAIIIIVMLFIALIVIYFAKQRCDKNKSNKFGFDETELEQQPSLSPNQVDNGGVR